MGAAQARARSGHRPAGTDRSSTAATEPPLHVAEPESPLRVAERPYVSQDDTVSQVFPWLYIGEQSAALNLGLLRRLGIRALINCTTMRVPAFLSHERDLTCLGVPVEDDPKEAISLHFERAAQWARAKDGVTLLVFCVKGISRSATIVLVLLMKNRTHAAPRTPHRHPQTQQAFPAPLQAFPARARRRACCGRAHAPRPAQVV